MLNVVLLKDLAGCGSAETLLAAILRHHPDLANPVDVEAIARTLGILEVRDLEVEGVASALMADIDKTQGVILCLKSLTQRHRRFAIAHQLGHFLIKAQRGDRQCTRRDLAENRRDTAHRKEEMQANRFAAGLLMPKPLFTAFVAGLGKPAVAHLPVIATAFDVTLDAVASRYLDLTQAMCALVFIKDGVVRYARASRSCPPLSLGVGDPAPSVDPAAAQPAWVAAEVRDWLVIPRDARPPKLTTQVLGKAGGVQVVMLFMNAAAEKRADEEDEKLASARPKFGR